MLLTIVRSQPSETVLIFGVGDGVSLAALQLSKLAGCRAIVTSRDDEKLRRALDLRADHAINAATRAIVKQIMALQGHSGFDVVIENVGQAVWASAIQSLISGGCIVRRGTT